jgi:hypothetical protein
MRGEEGELTRPVGEKMSSWYPTVETDRSSQDAGRKQDGLGVKSRLRHAQSMYHCMCLSAVTLMIVFVSSVLLSICFRRINHMVVKKPFAFIL